MFRFRFAIFPAFLLINLLCFSPASAVDETPGIAVLDFRLSGSLSHDQELGGTVAELFITSLSRDPRLEVVERGSLKEVLDEQALEMTGLVDESAAIEAGQLLGVEAIITGTITGLENYWEVSARCIEVESTSILAAVSGRVKVKDRLPQMADELAERLVESALPFLRGQDGAAGTYGEAAGRVTKKVYGLVGSEKVNIFEDPRVEEVLKKNGFAVSVDWSGSRRMATGGDLGQYDFVFPSGIQNARKISESHGIHDYHLLFYTPMAVASWKPIAKVLKANGLVREEAGVRFLDMAGLLALMEKGKRWTDLRHNRDYRVDRNILVTSTDPRTSNSGAMYLAIASFLENDNRVVTTEKEIREVASRMRDLFLSQGSQAASSREPFEDYLLMGMGKSPMVMIYESQFIEAAVNSDLSSDMVILYPEPTLYVKEVFVPITEAGDRLGKFMKDSENFSRLAQEHGMHAGSSSGFAGHFKGVGLTLPDYLVEVINPPDYHILEKMIEVIYR